MSISVGQVKANPKEAAELIAVLEAEIERRRAQLPDGIQHCTILFKECDKGHGRLTATNWVQHGCSQCEIDRLRSALEETAEGIYKPGTDAWEVVHQMREAAKAALGDYPGLDKGSWGFYSWLRQGSAALVATYVVLSGSPVSGAVYNGSEIISIQNEARKPFFGGVKNIGEPNAPIEYLAGRTVEPCVGGLDAEIRNLRPNQQPRLDSGGVLGNGRQTIEWGNRDSNARDKGLRFAVVVHVGEDVTRRTIQELIFEPEAATKPATDVGPLRNADMFGGGSRRIGYGGGVESQEHRGQSQDASERRERIIKGFTDKPRYPIFISMLLGFFCCAIGVAFNLNTQMRRGILIGNALTVIGVLAPLWLPMLLVGAIR